MNIYDTILVLFAHLILSTNSNRNYRLILKNEKHLKNENRFPDISSSYTIIMKWPQETEPVVY